MSLFEFSLPILQYISPHLGSEEYSCCWGGGIGGIPLWGKSAQVGFTLFSITDHRDDVSPMVRFGAMIKGAVL